MGESRRKKKVGNGMQKVMFFFSLLGFSWKGFEESSQGRLLAWGKRAGPCDMNYTHM
jgi:hypothetical protein